jgi:hypothetical protein
MQIFCRDIEAPVERRRAVMKVYMTLYGGILLYTAGILDQPRRDGADRGIVGDDRKGPSEALKPGSARRIIRVNVVLV